MVVRELVALLGFKTDDASLKKAESSTDSLKGAALKLSAIFLTGAVVAGFNKLIDLASESAESLNKFQAVFESATDSVQKQLDDTSKRTGIASMQLRQFAADIGAIVKPALGSAEAAGSMSASIAELALDVASYNDVEPTAALVALRAGLIGSAEPLFKFGVDLRVASLEAEALRQGITKSVKSMTEGERVQLRFAKIMRDLGAGGALGDATRTALGFANASRALTSQIKQLGATLGGFLLKDAGRTVAIYTKIVTAINDWLKVNKELIQQRVDQVLQVINNTIEGVVRTLGFIISGWQQLGEVLGPVASGLLLVTGILLALIAILGAPVVLFLAISAAIGLVIDDLVVFAQGGQSAFGLLIDKVKEFAERAGIDLGGFFDFFAKGWDIAAKAASDAWDTILEVAEPVIEKITELVKDIFDFDKDGAISDFKEVVDKVRSFLAKLLQNPLVKVLIASITARLGAAAGEFAGEQLARLIPKGRVGRAIEGATGVDVVGEFSKFVAGSIGKLVGAGVGAVGGFQGAGALGQALELPVPPGGGGGTSITTGATEMTFNISGAGQPEQVASEIGKVVRQEDERKLRATMNQLTTQGATP